MPDSRRAFLPASRLLRKKRSAVASLVSALDSRDSARPLLQIPPIFVPQAGYLQRVTLDPASFARRIIRHRSICRRALCTMLAHRFGQAVAREGAYPFPVPVGQHTPHRSERMQVVGDRLAVC